MPLALLRPAALAGTRRLTAASCAQSLGNLESHPAGKALLAALRQKDAPDARRLLRALSIAVVLQRGQWRPTALAPGRAPSAPDDAPATSLPQSPALEAALDELLRRPMNEGQALGLALGLSTFLVQRLLHDMQAAGLGLPHDLLAAMLQEFLPPLPCGVIGARGRWLARLNPGWQWRLEPPEEHKPPAPRPPPCADPARVRTALAVFLRCDRKGCWHLEPPAAFDPAWAALGMREALPKYPRIPEQSERSRQKFWWLLQLASATLLEGWQETLGMEPQQVLEWSRQQKAAWQPALEMGWVRSALARMAQGSVWPDAWRQVLRSIRWGAEWAFNLNEPLSAHIQQLSPVQREALWLELLQGGWSLPTFLRFVRETDPPCLSPPLSRCVLRRLAGWLCSRHAGERICLGGEQGPEEVTFASLYDPADRWLGSDDVEQVVLYLHASCMPDFAVVWQTYERLNPPYEEDAWLELRRRVAAFLPAHAWLRAQGCVA